jgi:putative membrane protein
MRLRSILLALPLVMLWQLGSAQQTPSPQNPPPRGTASFEPPPSLAEDAPLTAQTFVIRAAIVNMMEIDLADLALTRSRDAALQAYARKMRDEHWRAQEKLRSVAADAKIAMPAMPDKKHQDLKDALKRGPADEFDAGYVKAIVAGHDEAVALFDAAANGKGTGLPQAFQHYASEMLPIVRAHRDAAYDLRSSKHHAKTSASNMSPTIASTPPAATAPLSHSTTTMTNATALPIAPNATKGRLMVGCMASQA